MLIKFSIKFKNRDNTIVELNRKDKTTIITNDNKIIDAKFVLCDLASNVIVLDISKDKTYWYEDIEISKINKIIKKGN